jgi:hypothetical protein
MFLSGAAIGIDYEKEKKPFVFSPKIDAFCPEPKIPSCPNVSCQNLDYEEMKKVCLVNNPVYSQLQQIAENNSNEHEYVLNKYDCTEFSKQLIVRLKDAGYNAKFCEGYSDFNGQKSLHNWIKIESVYVEATSGKIIEPDYYAIHYSKEVCG